MKKLLFIIFLFCSFLIVPTTNAANNSFISIVNPIRGKDFWDLQNQQPETAVSGQVSILKQANLPAAWLLRFDALDNKSITDLLKTRSTDEKGLFLEVTPSWTTSAKVEYHKSASWHDAGSAFLTGYERAEREKLIDVGFEKFKSIFGAYPSSVGAWWIDSYSLGYMQKKYGIVSALIVADQYSTDNYQIWGQYFGTPYYPGKNNALHPAGSLENKLDIVMVQWAARDPVNGYGNGVIESTYSVQANDYIDYHSLDTKYFSSLVDIYTKQKFNQFGHLVVGLENSYDWSVYANEYKKQIAVLKEKKDLGQLSVLTLKDFANWYRSAFPKLSPDQIIVADDPLGSFKKTIWFMNPFYRAGWFINSDGSVFRDIRQYIDGEEELCFKTRCDSVNFATSATRVLDDISFGHKWVIDQGSINNFQINRVGENYAISYQNAAGNIRKIEFLPRDIAVDGKISSIDGTILNATNKESMLLKSNIASNNSLKWSFASVLINIGKYLLFFIFAVIIPGLILTNKLLDKGTPIFLRLFVSSVVGLVVLTFLFYIASILHIKASVFVYVLLSLIIFLKCKFYKIQINLPKIRTSLDLGLIAIILAGTIFQVIPTFKSGLNYMYGIGFWGPNTHDGVWHLSLINELVKSVPPESPIYSGTVLKNYHYFYDLLIAATNYLSKIPVSDLVFRFYPIIFSFLVGVGSYYLIIKLFVNKIGNIKTKVAVLFGLYLIYFGGSFGWIVEYIREKHFGGESAFWVNQAVSFNLNPPFAISLVILVTLLQILFLDSNMRARGRIIIVILLGTLISFKSYTGILVLGSLFGVAIVRIIRRRDFSYIWITFLSLIISIWLFLSNFTFSAAFIIFAPFWFIHSMVDSPDRVGWFRLSLARTTSLVMGQWPKFIAAESLSFVLFIIGNLGLRFLSLGLLIKIKEVFRNNTLLFISILSFASVIIPVLFIQSGNPWNTIQFFYPALYTSSIFTGLVISTLIFKMKKFLAYIFVFLFVILAPINSLVTANGYFGQTPHAFVSVKELEALQLLFNQANGVVLTYPYDDKLKQKIKEPWPLLVYGSTSYVSAFSNKRVYIEDESQNQILLTDYTKRLVASKDFFQKPILQGAKFLKDNQIRYIYLPKIYNVRLDEASGVIKKIFENDEAVAYKVN